MKARENRLQFLLKILQPNLEDEGQVLLMRSPITTANLVTAWWDASQIYGYDDRSVKRVQRDPQDPAKKLLLSNNYLPVSENVL